MEDTTPGYIAYSMEEVVEEYVKQQHMRDDLDAAMSVLKEELLFRLNQENIKGKVVKGYGVTKATRVSFKTTLAEAKELGAVKESIDTEMLKRYYDSGIQVPGVSVTEYILVKPLSKEDK